MPIYEYRCNECAQIFEEWQKDFSERQELCPVCGGMSERLISNSSFVLKGGGWYSDSYAKPASKKAVSSGGDGAAPPKVGSAPAGCKSCTGGDCAS